MRSDDPPRCDGCGEDETTARVQHTDEDGNAMVTYCPGCELLRAVRGIQPSEHEQYKLAEEVPESRSPVTSNDSTNVTIPNSVVEDAVAGGDDG